MECDVCSGEVGVRLTENGSAFECLSCGNIKPTPKQQPRKTWLDECAFYALNGTLLSEIVNETTGPITAEDVAKNCYVIAEAMLAEKMKREAKE